MFNNIKIKKIENIFNIKEEEAEELLKHQSNYLKINPTKLLNSFVVVERVIREARKKEAIEQKYSTKNIYILKYKAEIVDLYSKKGFGYLKISNSLKINHNVKVSKSAIENFLKFNNIEKAKNG